MLVVIDGGIWIDCDDSDKKNDDTRMTLMKLKVVHKIEIIFRKIKIFIKSII